MLEAVKVNSWIHDGHDDWNKSVYRHKEFLRCIHQGNKSFPLYLLLCVHVPRLLSRERYRHKQFWIGAIAERNKGESKTERKHLKISAFALLLTKMLTCFVHNKYWGLCILYSCLYFSNWELFMHNFCHNFQVFDNLNRLLEFLDFRPSR